MCLRHRLSIAWSMLGALLRRCLEHARSIWTWPIPAAFAPPGACCVVALFLALLGSCIELGRAGVPLEVVVEPVGCAIDFFDEPGLLREPPHAHGGDGFHRLNRNFSVGSFARRDRAGPADRPPSLVAGLQHLPVEGALVVDSEPTHDSTIPASSGVLAPFLELQDLQATTRFDGVSSPPRDRGTTWSIVGTHSSPQ